MKKRILFSMLLATGIIISGCAKSEDAGSDSSDGSGSEKEGSKTYTIGVTQIVEHPSLNEAYKGFQAALEEKGVKVEFSVKNAQGDPNTNTTIAQGFANDKVDLIFANSTPSAQAALSATKDIPIVFTSVTDAVGAGLVKSLDEPGENITGTIDTHPEGIPNTIKFIKEQLGGKNVGFIYNSGEQNSVVQIETAKKELEKLGMKAVTASVSTSAEVKQAAESLVGKIDAFYVMTDNTVVSALSSVISVANEKDIPLFAGEHDSVKAGAFAGYGVSYYDIGFTAGNMAAQILEGEKKPSELPVQPPKESKLGINKKAASEMGIELKPEWDSMAEYIE
ncbi:ABC transporter substrate binding protein [Peribacillus sp. SCS-155]|uniref:ABC transporter substrate binding protein n=1 Tax=Peribacillus sedimenti TaxID=3115297 RepID=UPI003906D405